MATLLNLAVNQTPLVRLDPQLDHLHQEQRCIYLSLRMASWITEELPSLESDRNVEPAPNGQFDDLVSVFCSGDTLTYEWQFKPLNYVADGIWELKTADLRIFGWFPEVDCFIAVVADTKRRIKDLNLVNPYANITVSNFRNELDLDEPKYIQSKEPRDVVTDYDFPG